jgi:hypothetical protein
LPKKKSSQKKNVLQAIAWRLRLGNNKKFTYRTQFNKVSNKAYPGLVNKMTGWSIAAEQVVLDNRSKRIVVFQRTFKSEKEFHDWGINVSFCLTEYSSTSDRPKAIKLGVAAPKKRGRKKGSKNKKKSGQKRCGNCGELGHNARTCKI